jgi:fructose-specific phosphotransferase system IIC component
LGYLLIPTIILSEVQRSGMPEVPLRIGSGIAFLLIYGFITPIVLSFATSLIVFFLKKGNILSFFKKCYIICLYVSIIINIISAFIVEEETSPINKDQTIALQEAGGNEKVGGQISERLGGG